MSPRSAPATGQYPAHSSLGTFSLHCVSENRKGIFSTGLLLWFPDFKMGAKNDEHLEHWDPKKSSSPAPGPPASEQQSQCWNPGRSGPDSCCPAPTLALAHLRSSCTSTYIPRSPWFAVRQFHVSGLWFPILFLFLSNCSPPPPTGQYEIMS